WGYKNTPAANLSLRTLRLAPKGMDVSEAKAMAVRPSMPPAHPMVPVDRVQMGRKSGPDVPVSLVPPVGSPFPLYPNPPIPERSGRTKTLPFVEPEPPDHRLTCQCVANTVECYERKQKRRSSHSWADRLPAGNDAGTRNTGTGWL